MNAKEFITNFKEKLARSLIIIITTIDPDAIVFGGGISNEIDFLDEIKLLTSKLINEPNLKTVFLKPCMETQVVLEGQLYWVEKILFKNFFNSILCKF